MPRKKDETEESDEFDDDDSQENEKIEVRKPKIERIDKFKNLKKIVINVSMTQYSVVSEVADQLNWKIQSNNDSGDWDVYWTDFSIDPDVLIRMHLFQKINHFPGIHVIARKNLLGINLTNMKKYYPDDYNFFPMTWMLPQQYAQFREYYQTKPKGKTRTYIVKPEADCQGRGIFLTRKLEDLQNGKHYVVQRYIARPYLLDGLKFDFRIYVLLCGTNPLKLYMYNQGLARLATELYTQPANANLDKLCMHLTNYAINKHNPKFIFNNSAGNMGIGHKRSLSCVWKQLANKGFDVPELKSKIKDLIIKTIITGLPLMRHQYKCSQPEDYSGNMCFHILGLDVMLNSKGQPFVLEVNHTPSFTTDTPLDHKIKFNLIKDTLVLMNVNTKTKAQLFNRSKQYNTERLLTGKRHIFEGEQRMQKIRKAQEMREQYEKKHLGGYEKIFPLEDEKENQKYEQMIEAAIKIYYQETNSIRNKNEEKQMKKMFKNEIKAKKAQTVQSRPPEQKEENPQLVHSSVIESTNKTEVKTPISNLHRPTGKNFNQKKVSHGNKSDKVSNKVEEQSRINRFKRTFRRQNSQANQKKDKSQQVIAQKVIKIGDNAHIRTRSRQNGTDIRKSQKNNIGQLPNISENTSALSQIFHKSQYQNMKKQQKMQTKAMIQSEPKPARIIDNLQRQSRLLNEKRMMLSGNGGYVMPKIFYMNLEQKQEELNFLTMGKKIQNHYDYRDE